MDLGHGFLPRTCARNYKAVERCLPRDGPGLVNVGLDLPGAILEVPWALQHGAPTIELCRDQGVSFLIDTEAWRYHDPRPFLVEKFATTPYAPAGPLAASDRSALSRFVEADLQAQASLGASAYLLPGVIPTKPRDDVHAMTLTLLETAQAELPDDRPCVAFLGVHTASMEAAHQLVDDLVRFLNHPNPSGAILHIVDTAALWATELQERRSQISVIHRNSED